MGCMNSPGQMGAQIRARVVRITWSHARLADGHSRHLPRILCDIERPPRYRGQRLVIADDDWVQPLDRGDEGKTIVVRVRRKALRRVRVDRAGGKTLFYWFVKLADVDISEFQRGRPEPGR